MPDTENHQTLGQKYGELVGMLMHTYQTGTEAAKANAISEFTRGLRIWYESQPTENRRDFARQTRRDSDYFNQIAALAKKEISELTLQDAA